MSMFYIGGELAQSRLGLPKSLTGVFQGLLLFTLLACDTLIAYRIALAAPRPHAAPRQRRCSRPPTDRAVHAIGRPDRMDAACWSPPRSTPAPCWPSPRSAC